MISSVHIKNFKIHKDNMYTFKPLTVLTGINSSGKSAIIAALRLNNIKSKSNSKIISLKEVNHDDFDAIINSHKESFFEINIEGDSNIKSHYRYFLKDEKKIHELRSEKIDQNTTAYNENNSFVYISQCRCNELDYTKLKNMTDDDFQMDPLGENTAEIISILDFIYSINKKLIKEYSNKQLNQILSNILKTIGINVGINIKKTDDTVSIEVIQNGLRNRLSNVGYGIAYILPILTAALITKPGGTLIIDSPEAHLHPMAQSNLGKFLTKIVASGIQVIIETHSDHIINGIQYAALNNDRGLKLQKDDIIFHFLSAENGFSHTEIVIDDNGKLSPTPKGFFDQIQNDLSEIIKLRMLR